MKVTTARQFAFWAIVMVIFAIGFGMGFTKLPVSGNDNNLSRDIDLPKIVKDDELPIISVQETPEIEPTHQIIYLTKIDGNTKILSVDETGNNPKTIFIDTNDQDKFKSSLGIKNDGQQIYLLVGNPTEDFTGKIISITTDGKATIQILNDKFDYSFTPPVISPTGDKLAQVIFNNQEQDFGFKVDLEAINGDKLKTLFNSTETISLVDFSLDGSKIALVKNLPAGGGQIILIDLTSGDSIGVYSTEKTIYALDFESSLITIAQAPAGANKANEAEIITMDTDGKNVSQITKNSHAETQLKISPNAKLIGYVANTFADGFVVTNQLGNLSILNLESKSENIIGKAQGVLGWIN